MMAWPLTARAQQRGKVPRLGVLLFSNPQTDPQMEVLRSGLRDLGYDDQSLFIFYRYAEGKPERLTDLAAALLREKPDLVLALGGDVAPYAVKATSTIPSCSSAAPIPSNLGSPRALLGLPAMPPASRSFWTILLRNVWSSSRRRCRAYDTPRSYGIRIIPTMSWRETQRAARSLNMQLQLVEMRGSGDLDNAFRAVIDGGCDALYVVSSRHTVLNIPPIVDFATRNKIPLAGGWGAWARAGGLLSYGPNINDMTRRVVNYVDKILKGAKPADLPVQQPTKFEFVVNTKAAKAIGVEVPPTLLARADEVIE